jgi:hypothetical protein
MGTARPAPVFRVPKSTRDNPVSFTGQKIFNPCNALHVGPCFLSSSCDETQAAAGPEFLSSHENNGKSFLARHVLEKGVEAGWLVKTQSVHPKRTLNFFGAALSTGCPLVRRNIR